MRLKRVKQSEGWRWGMSFLQLVFVAQVFFKSKYLLKQPLQGNPGTFLTLLHMEYFFPARDRCYSTDHVQDQWMLAHTHTRTHHTVLPVLPSINCVHVSPGQSQHPAPKQYITYRVYVLNILTPWFVVDLTCLNDALSRMVGWCVFYLHRLLRCFLWLSFCAASCWSLWNQDLASWLGCRHSDALCKGILVYVETKWSKTPKTEYIQWQRSYTFGRATDFGSTRSGMPFIPYKLTRLWLCSTSVELTARPVFQAARKLMETEKLGRWVRSGEMSNVRNMSAKTPKSAAQTAPATTWGKTTRKFHFPRVDALHFLPPGAGVADREKEIPWAVDFKCVFL